MSWICYNCSTNNSDDDTSCFVCGEPRVVETPEVEAKEKATKSTVADARVTRGGRCGGGYVLRDTFRRDRRIMIALKVVVALACLAGVIWQSVFFFRDGYIPIYSYFFPANDMPQWQMVFIYMSALLGFIMILYLIEMFRKEGRLKSAVIVAVNYALVACIQMYFAAIISMLIFIIIFALAKLSTEKIIWVIRITTGLSFAMALTTLILFIVERA